MSQNIWIKIVIIGIIKVPEKGCSLHTPQHFLRSLKNGDVDPFVGCKNISLPQVKFLMNRKQL